MSKLDDFIGKHSYQILNGRLMAVDPSSGSRESMPGYAIYEKGTLVESGTIEIPKGVHVSLRLQALCNSLQKEFPIPDVLAVEHIPPRIGGVQVVNLQRSIGVIMAALPCPLIAQVAPVSWKSHCDENYYKSDELDAIYIGKCVVERAKAAAGRK